MSFKEDLKSNVKPKWKQPGGAAEKDAGRSGNSLEAQQKRDVRLNVKENRRE